MRAKTTIRIQAAGVALVAGVATVAWAQAMKTVRYNGVTVSHNVRIIDGKPWVPLSDAARLVGGSVVPVGSGYEIQGGNSAAPGGANEVQGTRGKIGQMVFTGKWRVEVTSVETVDTYTSKHQPPDTVTPSGTGDQLVAVHCLVKNGVPKSRQLILRLPNAVNTALTDNQGQSYPPCYLDFPGDSGYGPILLPGASSDVTLLFSVPKGTSIKDLVFSLAAIEDNNPVDVRISLVQ
jgi:hypothetical protein